MPNNQWAHFFYSNFAFAFSDQRCDWRGVIFLFSDTTFSPITTLMRKCEYEIRVREMRPVYMIIH